MLDQLIDYEKPFLLAINGIGLGIGATIIGFADLVFMSSTARLRCPFTDLAGRAGSGVELHVPDTPRPSSAPRGSC